MEKAYRVLPSQIHQSAVPMGVYRHRVNPPREIPLERLLEVDCWDVVSDKFSVKEPHHQGQIIEVYPEGGEYYAELIAIKLKNGQVKTKLIAKYDLEGEAKAITPDFELKLKGPRKWCIVRTKDGSIVMDGIDTREQAEVMLAEYLKELAA